jgi:hypothetical protein
VIEIDSEARFGVWDYVGIAGLFDGLVDAVKLETLKPYVRPSVTSDSICAF